MNTAASHPVSFVFRNTGSEAVALYGSPWMLNFRPQLFTCSGVRLSSMGYCAAPPGGHGHCDPANSDFLRMTLDAGLSFDECWNGVVSSPDSNQRLLTMPAGRYQARRDYTALDGGSPRTAIRDFEIPTDGGAVVLELAP